MSCPIAEYRGTFITINSIFGKEEKVLNPWHLLLLYETRKLEQVLPKFNMKIHEKLRDKSAKRARPVF